MDAANARPAPILLSAPPWWAVALLLPGPVLAWYDVVARELASVPDAPAWFDSPALAWAGVGALVAGLLAETALYGMLWAARGRRLPFAACALVLLQISMLEVLAITLVPHVPAAGPLHAAARLLVGIRLDWGGSGPGGFASAFGSLGILTVLRMGLWAWAQAEGAGRPWREAALQVGLVWLASHVAQGWMMELIRGRGAS